MTLSPAELERLEVLLTRLEEGSCEPQAPDSIDRAEALLERPFPPQLRAWLERVDHAVLAEDNLFVSELWGEEGPEDVLGIATGTQALRAHEWHVPDELVLFAGDGSEGRFGIWMPREGDDPAVVVALDGAPQPGDRAYQVVGESLFAFFACWCAAFAHWDEDGAAYDLLGVPPELRQAGFVDDVDEDEELFDRMVGFMSPSLPSPAWPTFDDTALTVDELRAVIAALPRVSGQ